MNKTFQTWYGALLFFAVVVFLAYANALQIDFIGDDLHRLGYAENYMKQGLDVLLKNVLRDRPFLMLTVWLNYLVTGMSPVGFKIVNLFLHALVGLAMFQVIKILNGTREAMPWAILLTLSLFLLHPLNNQAINSIIQRGTLLSALLTLVSFYFFILFKKKPHHVLYALSLLSFLLAVLSKQNVLTYPLMLILYLKIFAKDSWKKTLGLVLPYGVICLIPALFYFVQGMDPQGSKLSWYEYLFIQWRVIFVYYKLLFYPVNLRFLYDYRTGAENIYSWVTLLAGIGHTLIFFGFYWLLRKKQIRPAFFGCLAYVAFFNESGVFAIKHVIFEHRAYFPFCFLTLSLVSYLGSLENFGKKATISLSVIAFSLIGFNWYRNWQIRDLESWTLNTISYKSDDRNFNFFFIHHFMEKSPGSAWRINEALLTRHPDDPIYNAIKSVLSVKLSLGVPLPEAIEGIENLFLNKTKMHWIARVMLNQFYFAKIKQLHPSFAAVVKVDDIVFPQLSFIQEREDKLKVLKNNYGKRLRAIQSYFANKSRLKNESDVYRYLRSLAVLEIFYDQGVALFAKQLNDWQGRHPDWQKLKKVQRWYGLQQGLQQKK